MSSAGRWIEEKAPAVLLLALPGVLQVSLALMHPGLRWPLALGLGLGLATFLAGVIVLVGSGWVGSLPELFTTSVAELHRRRTSLVQQTAVLRRVVEELTASTDRAATTTSRLLTELVRTEEATRSHLAAELHDTVAQSMSAALIALSDVTNPRHVEALESVRDAEEQLRTVLARIRPPELARGNLAQAVADLCADLAHRYGAQVDVRWAAGGLSLPTPHATLVYRFLQEALLNAVEHADGKGLTLSLDVVATGAAPTLLVEVADRGPGFDPSAVVSIGGRQVGLTLAHERARLAGGTLSLTSVLGEGTSLALRLPLPSGSLAVESPAVGPPPGDVAPNGATPSSSTGSSGDDDLSLEVGLRGPVTTG